MAAEKLHAVTSPDTKNQGDAEKDGNALENIFPELESVDLPLGTTLRYATYLWFTVKMRVLLILYYTIIVQWSIE